MNRLKTYALNAVSIVLALSLLGFFASLGLAVVGIALNVGLLGFAMARISNFLTPADGVAAEPAKAI